MPLLLTQLKAKTYLTTWKLYRWRSHVQEWYYWYYQEEATWSPSSYISAIYVIPGVHSTTVRWQKCSNLGTLRDDLKLTSSKRRFAIDNLMFKSIYQPDAYRCESCSSQSGAFLSICTEYGSMAFVQNDGKLLPDVTATLMQNFFHILKLKSEIYYWLI